MESVEQKRVNIGAALLDKILPGWYKQINLKKLNMSDGSLCMLGQLFGAGVESQLAREMYPEEMKAALNNIGIYYKHLPKSSLDKNGYLKAVLSNSSFITSLMKKNNINERSAELSALKAVCVGYDNKCEWANAIAERQVRDAKAKEANETPSCSTS